MLAYCTLHAYALTAAGLGAAVAAPGRQGRSASDEQTSVLGFLFGRSSSCLRRTLLRWPTKCRKETASWAGPAPPAGMPSGSRTRRWATLPSGAAPLRRCGRSSASKKGPARARRWRPRSSTSPRSTRRSRTSAYVAFTPSLLLPLVAPPAAPLALRLWRARLLLLLLLLLLYAAAAVYCCCILLLLTCCCDRPAVRCARRRRRRQWPTGPLRACR